MLRNHIIIAWRNLQRHKVFSLIKAGGFAVGIAACLLISAYVHQELNYDRFYKNTDRIYRLSRVTIFRGKQYEGVDFPSPFTAALQEDFPQLEKAGHMHPDNPGELRRDDRLENTHERELGSMDQEMLEILEVPIISGNAKKALTAPGSVIISRTKATQYFKNEDPIGKVLLLNDDNAHPNLITGVFEDFNPASHVHYDFILSLAGKELWPGELTDWSASNHVNYVLVKPGTDIASLQENLRLVLRKYMLPDALKNGSKKEVIDYINSMRFKLRPVNTIYMAKEFSDNLVHGDLRYIWLFGSIAGFILLIACINFINLSTARSFSRAKEVGIRKVSGSTRSGLVNQFLTEAIILSLISFLVACLLAWMALPWFSDLVGKSLRLPSVELWSLPAFGAGIILIGVVAGLYPAFYLSSFRPALVLKANAMGGNSKSAMRSALVVFQFAISVVLIISTVVISRQMNFLLTKDLGFNRDKVLVLESTHTLGDKTASLKNELLRLADVKSVSVGGFLPVQGSWRDGSRDGGDVWKVGFSESKVQSQHWKVDRDYVQTLGLTIVEGENFSEAMVQQAGPRKILINQWLAKALNMQNPIGQTITSIRGDATVVGVVKDFHFESLREGMGGIMLYLDPDNQKIALKLAASDPRGAIAAISKVWKQFSPNQAIRYSFLDASYAHLYDDVVRTGEIFTSFSVLAIIIACLGLFALSAYMIEQRKKEVSIRLVLGASLKNIFNLLTLDFLKLVLIAVIIAAPIAIAMMKKWLQDFSYQTQITWDIVAISGLIAVVIALVTISYQSLSAALVNPAQTLKSE